MLVSVIIPTYKPTAYIYECFDSLLNQTLEKQFFEILIILNGCNEPFHGNIKRYFEKKESKPQVCIIQTDVAGVSNARNLGISKSKGDFIAFVDDDDWVSPNYLYNLLSHSEEADIAISNVLQFDDVAKCRLPYYQTDAYNRCLVLKKMTFYNARSFLSSSCAKLISRKVIAEDRFAQKYVLGEDSLFMFQISKRIKKMSLATSDTIYYVRKRRESASHKPYPYLFRVRLAFSLSYSYLKIYLSAPFRYSFLLLATRIAATMLKLFQKNILCNVF